jgi:hypothetical protein
MNPSPARLALSCLALTTLGVGLGACGDSTTHTPPPIAGPSNPKAAAAVTAVSGPIPRVGPARSACTAEQGWSTRAKNGSAAMSDAALYLARVGRHACYDRVVFDINGPRHNDRPEPVGFVARYVPVAKADGSGESVPVPGHAVLQVTIRAPIYGTDNQGHQPWQPAPRVGQNLIPPAKIAGGSSLTAVTFAGSFEGQTTLAVGVREVRPFRVSVSSEQGYQHVILDIAH